MHWLERGLCIGFVAERGGRGRGRGGRGANGANCYKHSVPEGSVRAMTGNSHHGMSGKCLW